jgi:hypothetical protein
MYSQACRTLDSVERLLRTILARTALLTDAGPGANGAGFASNARFCSRAEPRASTDQAGADDDGHAARDACTGRRPAGLHSHSRDRGQSKLGDYLAHCAHLEGASVFAFERLACELNAHGAPLELVDEAISARGDEVRHTLAIGQLARMLGGEPVTPAIASLPLRTLEVIARENAVEGCVRETYGALLGGYQAEHAHNAMLRAALAEIAEDELRHAAFAHRVQRWIMSRLDQGARQRVRHAQQRAVFELAAEAAVASDPELRLTAGLPSPAMARVLIDELSRALWNPQGQRHGRSALG